MSTGDPNVRKASREAGQVRQGRPVSQEVPGCSIESTGGDAWVRGDLVKENSEHRGGKGKGGTCTSPSYPPQLK